MADYDAGGIPGPYIRKREEERRSKTPPRPDYRWVPGVGREPLEPTNVPRRLPAPPKVAVMVPQDIERAVTEYAEALNRWYDVVERMIEE